MIAMIAISLLNALFVNCHNLSITLKCFALFSLHCTVLTITKVTLCVRITCTSPVLTSLYFHHLQPVSLLLSNSRLSVVIRKREQQREEYPALPCGLIPEVVFNTIIEIINLYSHFYFCFVYFVYFEFGIPKAYCIQEKCQKKEVYFQISNPVQHFISDRTNI